MQTYVIKIVTNRIEKRTGIVLNINRVDLRPFTSLVLEDVLAANGSSDTLFYCKEVNLKANVVDIFEQRLVFDEITFNTGAFHYNVLDTSRNTNLSNYLNQVVVKREREEIVDKSVDDKWDIHLSDIVVNDFRFIYSEFERDTVDFGINWTDIDCRKLNLVISNIDLSKSPITFRVDKLNAVERSGFVLKSLTADAQVTDSKLVMSDIDLSFLNSNVDIATLQYNWTPNNHDWRNFITRMQQYYKVRRSDVNFADLAYFNDNILGISKRIFISGEVEGTVSELRGYNIICEWDEYTHLEGEFSSRGLPYVYTTDFDIVLTDSRVGTSELADIYLPWFDMNIPVPQVLKDVNYLDVDTIRFDGLLEDFEVSVMSSSDYLDGKMYLKYAPLASESELTSLIGSYNFNNIDLDYFSGISALKKASLAGLLKGVYGDDRLDLELDNSIQTLQVNSAVIRDADLKVALDDDEVEVIVFVNDDLVSCGGAILYNMGAVADTLTAYGHLDIHNLSDFDYVLSDSVENISISFDLAYIKTDTCTKTNMYLSDLSYSNSEKLFVVDDINIYDSICGVRQHLNIESDKFSLSLKGDFDRDNFTHFDTDILSRYAPSAFAKPRSSKAPFDFECEIDIKNIDDMLVALYPDLSIANNTSILMKVDETKEIFDISLASDSIRYNYIDFYDFDGKLRTKSDTLFVDARIAKMLIQDKYDIYSVNNHSTLVNNVFSTKLNWGSASSDDYYGDFLANVAFSLDDKRELQSVVHIDKSLFTIKNNNWKIAESWINISGDEIKVRDFMVSSGDKYLSVLGDISRDENKTLRCNINDFEIGQFADIILNQKDKYFGDFTGIIYVQDFYKQRLLLTDMFVHNFGVTHDTIGDVKLFSSWDVLKENINLEASVSNGDKSVLDLKGYYQPRYDSISFILNLNELELKRFNYYVDESISNISGELSGNIDVRGTIQQYDVAGAIKLDSVACNINMLNTSLWSSDSVYVSGNNVLLRDFKVHDVNNNEAQLNGNYNIATGIYRANALFNNFRILNTRYSTDALYYGVVSLSGLADINNVNGIMNINTTVKAEKGSRLFVPLTASADELKNNFLFFEGSDVNSDLLFKSDLNLNLEANIELNDNLEVQLIFDPTVGDILKIVGDGNVKMIFDKDSELAMFGNYEIIKGDYLFTLSNLVNKKFDLTEGGRISWSGSPYDATLDLQAVYRTKTTISELFSSGGLNNLNSDVGKKVAVECLLRLSDKLTNPNIDFAIDFPTLDTQSKNYIESLFSSQDEINKQMLSLLLLNSFYETNSTGGYGSQVQTAGLNTLTEMISNQMSRWVSNLSDNIDIGVAYKLGDVNDEFNSDELEVAVSTQLFNNRVTVSAQGNVGMDSETNTNADNEFAGDFDIDVKLNEQGTLRLKAYSHSDEQLLYNRTDNVQGIGVSYLETFDNFKELLRKYFGFLRRKK